MKVLNKFTLRSLKLNKKRSLVTTIGIILSIALICAVAGMFGSFRATLIESEINIGGRFHTVFRNSPKELINNVSNHRDVESYFYNQPIGYAKFDSRFESGFDEYSYLFIMGFSELALTNSGIQLLEGRLPENQNEILITTRVNSHATNPKQIGDILNLDLYNIERNFSFDDWGNILESSVLITTLFNREYKVVGIAQERLNHLLLAHSETGITVITYLEEPTSNINLFVYYYNPRSTDEINSSIASSLNLDDNNILTNRELLRWQGVMSDNNLRTLYGIAAVIISIIIFTSVFVIRNGFAISVLERTRDYGILASIGTTKKQIKKSILFEGFILGIIAIPLGIIFGILAVYILVLLINMILADDLFGSTLIFVIPYSAVLISTLLGALTIYLSSIFIAIKTSRVSPIINIRNNDDIKIKAKKLKAPKFIKKLFGMGGVLAYKNIKRNKKRYSTTVISMIVSVIIFITMSSFINYTFREAINHYETLNFNISVNTGGHIKPEDIPDYLNKIRNLLEADETYWILSSMSVSLNNRYIDLDKAEHWWGHRNEYGFAIVIYSIGERGFRDFVNELGLIYHQMNNQAILVKATRPNDSYYKITNHVQLITSNETINLPVAKVTRENPIHIIGIDFLIVSEDMFKRLVGDEPLYPFMLIDANYPDEIELAIKEIHQDIFISNFQASQEHSARMILIISIFLYGFITVIITIGLTNIINTLATSINLRQKEFAMLKAVGITNKEFKQMINLESIFLGVKVLIIGIPIGMLFSYIIYYLLANNEITYISYDPNIFAIITSTIAVFLIVKMIMSFSLRQINKQNIIDTIRKDNI